MIAASGIPLSGGSTVSRLVGLEHRSAREQFQRSFPRVGVQPLPDPYKPGRVKAADVGIADPGDPLSFFVLGDVGGVKAVGPQNAVSVAMEQRQAEAAFALILGDVVYFNGEESSYHDQFYEPYAKLLRPIIAFPGNHDGDALPGDTSLAGFMTNFCDTQPNVPAVDPQLEYGRHTETLPYCEWTLELDAVTIVAVYTNVPSGGHLEPQQLDRLTQELKDADPAKPLIVGLHHPPYSIDAHHGGSKHMTDALDRAFEDSGRVPDLVLSGHVHDYQRFTRTVGGKQVPYIVSGNGGYHNLHQLAGGAAPGDQLADGVVFEYGDASRYGFLKLTVSGDTITGEYVGARPGAMPDGSDAQITPALDTF
jgi:predicted MPP superfamily phosphohydrolase